jgi:hypothetical protein
MASVNNIEDKFIKSNKPKFRKNPKEIVLLNPLTMFVL